MCLGQEKAKAGWSQQAIDFEERWGDHVRPPLLLCHAQTKTLRNCLPNLI